MYRLPSQFDPAGRQDDLSAAGGGSTSTTCSSCLVTLGAASAVTATIFSGLIPTEGRSTGSIASLAKPATEPLAADVEESESNVDADSQMRAESGAPSEPEAGQRYNARLSEATRQPMSTGERRVWGALSLILAAAAGGVAFLAQPLFGAIVFFAVYIGIFCLVYERSNRPVGLGALVAIVMLIGIVAAAAFEMYVWIENM